MKQTHILNAKLIQVIASLGHTQNIVICDAGFPIPANVKVIDLSIVRGMPAMLEVLRAIAEELVIESFVVASELEEVNPDLLLKVREMLNGIPYESVVHDHFKEIAKSSYAIIRTGECLPFANIILIGGVNF